MQEPSYQYYFALLAPDRIAESYRNASLVLLDEYGVAPLAEKHDAHLTIKRPFMVGGEGTSSLIRRIESVTRKTACIPATVGMRFGQFAESGVAYLPIDAEARGRSTPLMRTIDAFLGEFERCGQRRRRHEGETPHITYAEGLSEPRLEQACALLDAASGAPFGQTVVFTHAALFARAADNPHGRWHLARLSSFAERELALQKGS
jgi:2'-5' RNA ligase